ncbi:MAG: protein kinase domain-containing protein [Kofleriaceae bacterium]
MTTSGRASGASGNEDTWTHDGDSGQEPGAELAAGTMVGEYRVERLIGEGGMGRVYAATHPVIAKRAAIKVLHPALSVNRDAVERFIQEARSVNQIGHPNIVDIFAFGSLPDGRCYLVMELLRGESLATRLDRGVPALAETCAVLDGVLVALEAAHEAGIVHRDLKPDNIFLVATRSGPPVVKLLDFGIAKLLGADGSRTERTETGNLLGTPAYISPEQARGQGVDHRTDIYALGGVAYQMLTGQLPFPANNAADMLAKQLLDPPPSARLVCPMVPAQLDALVVAMLAKEAAHRPTLAQVRAQLVAAARGDASGPTLGGGPWTPAAGLSSAATISLATAAPVPTPTPTLTTPARSSRRLLWIAIAAVATIAASAVVIVSSRGSDAREGDPPPAPARSQLRVEPIEPTAPAAAPASLAGGSAAGSATLDAAGSSSGSDAVDAASAGSADAASAGSADEDTADEPTGSTVKSTRSTKPTRSTKSTRSTRPGRAEPGSTTKPIPEDDDDPM